MNGVDGITLWKNLKQRLSFKGLGCCGSTTWTPRTTIRTIIEEEEEEQQRPIISYQNPVGNSADVATSRMMNLRMALAAERNLRRPDVGPVKTLMRLIEETDGVDWRKKRRMENENDNDEHGGKDWVCCVCMERNKGAAFIPCGHTFCRVCSREMWANRGSCPVCNRSILEILDIF